MSIELVKKQGFDSPAADFYDIPTGANELKIWSAVPQLHADYLVFHEFTHIFDAAKIKCKLEQGAYMRIVRIPF